MMNTRYFLIKLKMLYMFNVFYFIFFILPNLKYKNYSSKNLFVLYIFVIEEPITIAHKILLKRYS